MGSNPNAEALGGVPDQHWTNGRIRQCASFCAHPKSFASCAAKHPWPHISEIRRKLMLKILRNLEVDVRSRLGFFRRDDDGPLAVFLDHIASDFERGEILVSQRNMGEQRDQGHCMQPSNENPPFEQIGKPEWDPSGVFRIRYGSGLDDPMPFMLTVTLPYVARELGKSVSFAEISKYVEQNADKLKATARFAKIGRGFATHTLE